MAMITWIGIGKMGSRMSRRLLDAGNDLIVCDRIKENADSLIKAGAHFIKEPADSVKNAEFIFTMIPNSDILLDIVTGEKGIAKKIKKGSVIVDMSTVSPKASSIAAEAVEKAGCNFLRSPVTGSTLFAENGTLGILCSGNKDVYEKTLPLLKILGNKQYYIGLKEESRYIKLAINMMLGNISQALAEALTFGERAGLNWAQMLEVFSESAAGAPLIKYKVEPLRKRDFSPASTVRIMEKDLDLALDVARERGIALPITSLSRQYLSAARATGKGDKDMSSIILVMEELSGIKQV